MPRPVAASASLVEFVSADGLEACLARYAAAGGEAGVVKPDARPSAAWTLAWLRALKSVCGPARAATELGLPRLGGVRLHRLPVTYSRHTGGGRQYARASPQSPQYEDTKGRRSHASLCAQGCPRELRGTLYPHALDLDIVNCHPTLLSSLSSGLGLECKRLRHYVKDREVRRPPEDARSRPSRRPPRAGVDLAAGSTLFARGLQGRR